VDGERIFAWPGDQRITKSRFERKAPVTMYRAVASRVTDKTNAELYGVYVLRLMCHPKYDTSPGGIRPPPTAASDPAV
jgi:hypothetical protein